ncbi:MAG: excinuclease ABC subunit C, partial [Candidatus Omnitrophica bacterium]|nr:excinuclease ABC subunit C [Candidatus Omnitrophota bacterium]
DKSSPYIHLNELKKVLSLPRSPEKIEAIDISDISGDKAVGSLVAFKGGRPDKDGYRRFKIKGVSGIDDYKMMQEVVERSYRKKKNLPDLLLIDGGRGHLSTVMQKLAEMKLLFPVAALAKKNEKIFLPYSSSPLVLKKNSEALHLLQQIRDEAHRFAISYHKRLRRRALKESGLDEIKGIGAQRKKRLLSYFGSLDEIRKSGVEELKKLGLSEKLSKKVIKSLDKKK